jgi:hypothetical protein
MYDGLWVMVSNATFDNISVISWWSVLLVEETGENHRPVTCIYSTTYDWIKSFLKITIELRRQSHIWKF